MEGQTGRNGVDVDVGAVEAERVTGVGGNKNFASQKKGR